MQNLQRLILRALRQVVDSTAGDVVQLVRTLPRHWLESYTVTAGSFYPALSGGFLCLLAVHSRILRCFELTSLQFSPLRRFSKFPISHAVVPESISYVRMSCFIVGQRATVREQLRNYCATRISTVCPADARPSPASTTERLTDLAPKAGQTGHYKRRFSGLIMVGTS
jgi:hypothetical protein